jgi:hypothetical protein
MNTIICVRANLPDRSDCHYLSRWHKFHHLHYSEIRKNGQPKWPCVAARLSQDVKMK